MKALVSFLLLATTFATSAVTVEQAINLCRSEQNAVKRLQCYDAIATTIAAQSVSKVTDITSTSTQADTVSTFSHPIETAADIAQSTNSEFGREHRQNPEQLIDSLDVIVSNIKYSPYKSLIVTFDNGQQWRQIGTDYYKIAVGEVHHINRGALNSFMLSNDNNNRTIRIRREQ